jgi:hypothetical protein
MGKFRELSLKLETNQRAYFGTNDSAYIEYNGSSVNITTAAGVNIQFEPNGTVLLDGRVFPTTSGVYAQTLTLSGTYLIWSSFT